VKRLHRLRAVAQLEMAESVDSPWIIVTENNLAVG
jgi:hypothetical protein